MKIFKAVSILPVLVLLLAGCGKDKATTPAVRTFPAGLVETWDFQSVTVNGQEAVLRIVLNWQEGSVRSDLTISADGNLRIDEFSADDSILYYEEGTIAVNDDYFTLTIYNTSFGVVSPPAIDEGTWAISGNQLTLYLNRNENIVALVATRQT